MEVVTWVKDNYVNLFWVLSALVSVGEIVTRFTKTEKDDGFVQRLGEYLKKAMDFLKVPNRKK